MRILGDIRRRSIRHRNTFDFVLAVITTLSISGCSVTSYDSYAPGQSQSANTPVILTLLTDSGVGFAGDGDRGTFTNPGFVSAIAAIGNDLYLIDLAKSELVRTNLVTRNSQGLLDLVDANTSGLHVTASQEVFVIDGGRRAVLELDWNGRTKQQYLDRDLLPAPGDIALIRRGMAVAVTDRLYSHIVIFDRFGGVQEVIGERPSNLAAAQSISAIAATSDSLYLLDTDLAEVNELDLHGNLRATHAEDALRQPTAMAVDRCGRIFIADRQEQSIYVAMPDLTTSKATTAANSSFVQNITDMWVDSSRLYLAAGANGIRIMQIEPTCAW